MGEGAEMFKFSFPEMCAEPKSKVEGITGGE